MNVENIVRSKSKFLLGGFDNENNMFCYGKDAECILYKSEDECKKLDLKKLLDNPKDVLKGFSKPEKNREIYSKEDLDGMVKEKNMIKSEFGENIVLECKNGFHLEGTHIIDDFYVHFKICTM